MKDEGLGRAFAFVSPSRNAPKPTEPAYRVGCVAGCVGRIRAEGPDVMVGG
jgi:hypothetical protein